MNELIADKEEVSAFFQEGLNGKRKVHTCEKCNEQFVRIRFGQNLMDINIDGKTHLKAQRKCFLV